MSRACLAASTALFTIFTTFSAQAAVTPEQVWQNWQDLSADLGQSITTNSVARQGDTLVVNGLTLGTEQDGAKISGTLEELRLRDMGDGRVEITMSNTYPVVAILPGEDGSTEELELTFTQDDLITIASGDETETVYNFQGSTVNIAAIAKQNGEKLADFSSTISGVVGDYKVTTRGTQSEVESSVAVQKATLNVDATTKGSGDQVKVTGDLSDLKMASNGTFLSVAEMADPALALNKGFASALDMTYGPANILVESQQAGQPTTIRATNASGQMKFSLGKDAISYGGGGTGVEITASGAQIPFPELKISYGEASFDFLMPVAKSQSPQDFTLLTRIVDLAVSEEIWAMIDPGKTLPRDPATLIIDTKGTAQLHTDLMDETAMASLGEAGPGDLHSLDLTNLTVKFAGAEVTGAGAFTFDNNDKTTYDGLPAPTGKIDLVLSGVNGLMDKLQALGLITAEQVQQARMGMMMLTREGSAPDSRESTIELQGAGITVNGMKIQ